MTQLRHARRLHARQLRHLEPRLPDVHGRHAQRRLAASTRPSATAAPTRSSARSRPDEYARTWYRQNPPLPRVEVVAAQQQQLRADGPARLARTTPPRTARSSCANFYLKSKRSIEKPQARGAGGLRVPRRRPASRRAGGAAARAAAPGLRDPSRDGRLHRHGRLADEAEEGREEGREDGEKDQDKDEPQGADEKAEAKPAPETRTFPAGSYVVRMDQPYSRIADAMLDYQYWSPDDPQKTPLRRHRLDLRRALRRRGRCASTDPKVLDAPMERVDGSRGGAGRALQGDGTGLRRQPQRRHRPGDAALPLPERGLRGGGGAVRGGGPEVRARLVPHPRRRPRGALGAPPRSSASRSTALRRRADGRDAPAPRAAHRPPPHLALRRRTRAGGGQAFDMLQDPLRVHQHAGRRGDAGPAVALRRDPVPARRASAPQPIVAGMPMWGNPLPWKTTALTPNLGTIDATDDMRPGLDLAGVAEPAPVRRRRRPPRRPSMDTAELAVEYGLAPGVSVADGREAQADRAASCARSSWTRTSPDRVRLSRGPAIFSFDGPIFNLSNVAGRPRQPPVPDQKERPTGRGTAGRSRFVVGRPVAEPPEPPKAEPWEALPLTEEQRRNNPFVIPPAYRPRVASALRRRQGPARLGPARGRQRDRPASRRSWTSRSRRGTSCSSRTTRSGAARPAAATSSSSTRS